MKRLTGRLTLDVALITACILMVVLNPVGLGQSSADLSLQDRDVPNCTAFGDANCDGYLDLLDLVALIYYVIDGTPEPCPELLCGDEDGDCDVDWCDVLYLLDYLFLYGPPPAVPNCKGVTYINDPGYADTLSLFCDAAGSEIPVGRRVCVEVYFFNDENIEGLDVSIDFTEDSLSCDSISYVGTRLGDWSMLSYRTTNIDDRTATAWLSAAGGSDMLTPGSGLLFKVWLTTQGEGRGRISFHSVNDVYYPYVFFEGGPDYCYPPVLGTSYAQFMITSMTGDVDGSGGVDIDDIVFMIQYVFQGGPEPNPLESGDVDCSGGLDIDDIVYLISYVFQGGYEPGDPDGDGDPDC